jgi:hypothetical protein
MDITELLEPVLTNGIRVNNFFNGRVLTAEDLRAEQQANRAQHRQLALAIGEGVVHGLEVSAGTADDGTPLLRVTPGLAFNRDGDAVALGRRADVRLVAAEEAQASAAGLFAVCQPRARALDLTNVGLYVLSASPASALSSERAPAAELGAEGIASRCASRWAQEGARFSVAPLPLAPADTTPTPLAAELAEIAEDVEEDVDRVLRGGASDTPEMRSRLRRNLSRLRNGAAYLCFGADTEAARRANPLPSGPGFPDPTYAAVEGMRERKELTSCEVLLALFYLSRRGIEWVDAWAVRRPPVPALTAGTLEVLPGRRREVEAVAMVLQFQQQVREIAADSGQTPTHLAALRAADYFRYLPPVGLLPIQRQGLGQAFVAGAFFGASSTGSATQIAGARLPRLLGEALFGPPVDLAIQSSVELYRARENVASGGSAPDPYIVFVNRDTQGLRTRDPVAAVFQDCWSAYRTLLRLRVFVPTGAGSSEVVARLALPLAVQGIMGVALQNGTLAAARRLPSADALDSFALLRTLQTELADLLESGMVGVPDAHDRLTFARRLHSILNTETPTGGHPGLGPAINQRSVLAAVRAQQAINHLIGSWRGGSMVITHLVPEGEQAVGQVLVIHGRNFAFPPIGNTIHFNDVELTAIPGFQYRPSSNDAQLEFVIPEIPDIGEGRRGTLRVRAGDAVVEHDYHILPPLEVEGQPPAIAHVRLENNDTNLRVGQVAVITGENFAADRNGNLVQLLNEVTHRVTDVSADDVLSASETQIRFRIPTLDELPERDAVFFEVRVTVGRHPPAAHRVRIRR